MKRIIAILLIVASFTACRKNGSEDNFDPTRYYIAGKINADIGFAITLTPGGSCDMMPFLLTRITNLYWKFQNNHLIIASLSSDINGTMDFTISKGMIENVTATGDFDFFNHLNQPASLQKIPSADAFAGKQFSVSLNGQNTVFTFDANGRFSMLVNNKKTDGVYILENNGVATAAGTPNGANDGMLFVMIDGVFVF